MKEIKSGHRILDFAPSFKTGVTSILRPTSRTRHLRKVIMDMKQNDGFYDDWQAIGHDFRNAMSQFNKDLAWQRK